MPGGIQRGQRFIQQPQRGTSQNQPGQRHATLLPGRQARARDIVEPGQTHALERRSHPFSRPLAIRPEHTLGQRLVFDRGVTRTLQGAKPEEILGHGQQTADPRPVAQVQAVDGCSRAVVIRLQARDDAQQRGLAAAVRAGQLETSTRTQIQIQSGEQRASVAHDPQAAQGQQDVAGAITRHETRR